MAFAALAISFLSLISMGMRGVHVSRHNLVSSGIGGAMSERTGPDQISKNRSERNEACLSLDVTRPSQCFATCTGLRTAAVRRNFAMGILSRMLDAHLAVSLPASRLKSFTTLLGERGISAIVRAAKFNNLRPTPVGFYLVQPTSRARIRPVSWIISSPWLGVADGMSTIWPVLLATKPNLDGKIKAKAVTLRLPNGEEKTFDTIADLAFWATSAALHPN